MKSTKDESIRTTLKKQLEADGYDLVELVQIPKSGDRMVRLQTLEEALEEFDRETPGESSGFLIQVRRRTPTHAPVSQPSLPRGVQDGVYQPDGRLNVAFLARNAEILYRSGDYTLARNILKSIEKSGERSAYAHFWTGKCLEAERKLEDARHSYEESLTYQPSLEVYQSLASVMIELQKDQNASETLERALNLKDLTPEVRFELHKAAGNCWMRSDRNDRAEFHYRKALEVRPTDDSLYSNLGALYLHLSRNAEARKNFERAVAINPRNDSAWTGLGTCYFVEENKNLAHDCFARALELQINNPTAIYYLVKLSYDLKNYTTAARLLGHYIEIAPVNAHLLYSFAGIQFHLGRMDEARRIAQQILEIQPTHSGARDLLKLIEKYSSSSAF